MADQTGPTPPRWRQRRRPRGAPSTQGPPSGTDANNQGTVVDHSPGSHVQAAHQGDAVTKPRGFQQKPKGGNAQPRNQNPRPNNAPVSTAPATVRRPGPVITDLTAQKSSQAASQEPIDMSKPMVGLSLQTVSSDGLGMLPGQRCEQDIVLAPWKLVTNYPSIYIHEEDREEARAYFTNNLQKQRSWDFYYILQPGSTSRDTLLLVPLSQLQDFIGAMTKDLGPLRVISQIREDRLLDTAAAPSIWPRPRFLAKIKNVQGIKPAIKVVQDYPGDSYDDFTIEQYKIYKRKVEVLHNAGKWSTGRENIAMSRMEQLEKNKRNGRALKRVQRYLGLRGNSTQVDQDGNPLSTWLPTEPAPFVPKDNVRFVCIDVEAWEFDANTLTEFGFTVLDTEDIRGIAPGVNGSNWVAAMKPYHYIINDYSHLKNKRFVKGCPEKFRGKSDRLWLSAMPKIFASFLGDPGSPETRPVVVVGHDILGDLKYVRQAGYNVWEASQIVDEIDTQVMFRRIQRSPNGRSLVTACDEMGIQTKDLHNAGNDAYFTLAAMVTMAVKSCIGSKQTLKPWQMVEEAEWSDGELDDGGLGQRSEEPLQKPKDIGNGNKQKGKNQKPRKKAQW